MIGHVETYIREFISTGEKSSSKNVDLENALARAIYEFLYRTVEYSPFFTSRINEQIRYFYFYFFVGKSLKISIPCSFLALFLMGLSTHTCLGASRFMQLVKLELLMGIEQIALAIPAVATFSIVAYVLSRRFDSTARGIILTELYTRHVFLVSEKERICELAKVAKKDPTLMTLFEERIDKEKGSIGEKKQ